MRKRIVSLALTLAILAAFVPAVPVATAAAFTPITGWDMMEKLGAGITFANTTEARSWPWYDDWVIDNPLDYETCWGQPEIEQWHFQSAAQKGFDSYRLCVSWTPQMDKDGKINKVWMDRIQQLADWALDAGLNVVLNTHHEEELYWLIRDGEYEAAKKHLTALWKQVAERFKDYPETLLFEIMNEPNLLEHYGGEGEWIYANGEVSQALCDTVNKLNLDALETIRKSGGNNDKRVVMFCVPGAHPDALPYMKVPDNDPYIMLATFGYDDLINKKTYPLVQAWLDKGIGFVNKEDAPGECTARVISDLVGYTKQHFGDLAGMGIPSFYFTGGESSPPYSKSQLIDRITGEWVNKPLLEAYFAAYGKKPGPDYVPTPAFPYEIKDVVIPGEPTWFTIPPIELAAAEKMVVETNEKLNWFQFESMSSDEWKGFQSGDSRVAEEEGKLILDLRGLNLSGLGFRTANGDDNKVKRIYIDTWAGSEAPNLDAADSWAHTHINEGYAKGFIPAALQNNYKANITRAEFVTLAMSWLRYKTGLTTDQLVAKHAIEPDRTFSDTTNTDILAAGKLDITAGAGGGRFGVNDTFSRQQAAVMLTKVYRILGEDDANAPEFGFADIGKAESWAKNAINYVKSKGVMNGVGDGTSFDPLGTFTRQQSIIVFNQMG